MTKDVNNKKRCGIFFFFDKDGKADTYVYYLLKSIAPFLSHLLVVVNGKLLPECRNEFTQLGADVFVRENIGFDVMAYKEAIESIGYENLKEYDELILFNYTIFGPLYPFSEMFDKMDALDSDFWGITMYNGAPSPLFEKINDGKIPVHLQSHFLAIGKKMLGSIEFKNYWTNMRPISSYDDSVMYHEATFTKHFAEAGFTWKAYVDTGDCLDDSHYPLIMMPVEMVRDRRCPIIKRKSFFQEIWLYLDESTNEPAMQLLEFIKNHTDYDVDMIWENLIRTCNLYDIKNCLNLNYILPTQSLLPQKQAEAPKVALIIHLYDDSLIQYCLHYASSMPAYVDVYITTNTEEKKEKISQAFGSLKCNKLEVRLVKNLGRDVSALLVGCRDIVLQYDYVCFAHDKSVAHIKPHTKGMSFSYITYEGVLSNNNYVENVIETFCENPRLGLLAPPPPNHADYYPIIGDEWTCNFENCVKLAKRLNIKAEFSATKPPIAPLGSIFWFRSKALSPIFEYPWKYEDFHSEPLPTDGTLSHAIERIYPFVAQHSGYYAAWVMPDNLAKLFITNIYYYLRSINCVLFRYGFHPHSELVANLTDQFFLRNMMGRPIPRKTRIIWGLRLLTPIRVYNLLRKIKHKFLR